MSRSNQSRGSAKTPFCKVCKDAGKSEREYTSHYVKDRNGNTTCPTLLSQECRYCFKTGHTVKFCPVIKERDQQKEREQKVSERVQRVRAAEATKAQEKQKKNEKESQSGWTRVGGQFASLADDSDEDDRVAVPTNKTQEEEFPALSAAKISNVTLRPHQQHFAKEGASFAAKTAAPKPVSVAPVFVVKPPASNAQAQHKNHLMPASLSSCQEEQTRIWGNDAWSDDETQEKRPAALAAAAVAIAPVHKMKKSWADWDSDSDDE